MKMRVSLRQAPMAVFGVTLVLMGSPSSAGPSGSAQEQLLATVKSNAPPASKWAAAHELAVTGTREVVPALAALLADEQLSHLARSVLEAIPDPAVDDALRDALSQLKGRLL